MRDESGLQAGSAFSGRDGGAGAEHEKLTEAKIRAGEGDPDGHADSDRCIEIDEPATALVKRQVGVR